MPLFAPGMDPAEETIQAARRQGLEIGDGDVIVLAQKIVSKAEGRGVRLSAVQPSAEAQALGARTGRPAALMQLILNESESLLRVTPNVIVARRRGGQVAANAGIDASNIEGGETDTVLLWPADPDSSARAIRAAFRTKLGRAPAVAIADSLGRAWRLGTLGHAIGAAGLVVVDDRRGEIDLFGRTLQATMPSVADSAAAAAALAMGEGAEGAPAVLVRGLDRYVTQEDGPGAISGLRALNEDLFQ